MHRNGFSFLSASHSTGAPFHSCWQTSSLLLAVPWLTMVFTAKWNFSSLVPIRDMCASPLVSFHKHALHLKDGTPSSHPYPSHCQYLCCRLRWDKYAFFLPLFIGQHLLCVFSLLFESEMQKRVDCWATRRHTLWLRQRRSSRDSFGILWMLQKFSNIKCSASPERLTTEL